MRGKPGGVGVYLGGVLRDQGSTELVGGIKGGKGGAKHQPIESQKKNQGVLRIKPSCLRREPGPQVQTGGARTGLI